MVIDNQIFLTIIFAAIGVQLVKVVLFLFKHGRVHWLDLIATGGMPSSHSALVTGLVTIIYLTEGLTSVFFVALALMFVVIVDAMGVRRTAGEEGMVIRRLIKHTKMKLKEPHFSMGHTPAQVFVGGVLGILVAIVVNLL